MDSKQQQQQQQQKQHGFIKAEIEINNVTFEIIMVY